MTKGDTGSVTSSPCNDSRSQRYLVIDATVQLGSPAFDGDHSSASGFTLWQESHIPDSIHLDQLTDIADPQSNFHFAPLPAPELAAVLAKHGIAPDSEIVTYDTGDSLWAARLWRVLTSIGLKVRVLDGGLPAWSETEPVSSGDQAPLKPVDPWIPHDVTQVWASKSDVEAIVAGNSAGALVCALGLTAFEGTVPTRYTRRGRIPGSISIPARDHIGVDGLVKTANELRAAFDGVSQRPLIVYCGGGISASLSALALYEIGETEVLIYDGSLEEWSADPDAPLLLGAND